jgi:transposase-like protein
MGSYEEDKETIIKSYFKKKLSQQEIARKLGKSPRDVNRAIKEHREESKTVDTAKKNIGSSVALDDGAKLEPKAYELFKQNMTPIDVAIKLKLPGKIVMTFYEDYLNMEGLGDTLTLHKELSNDNLKSLRYLHENMLANEMDPEPYASQLKAHSNDLKLMLEANSKLERHYKQSQADLRLKI